MVENLMYKGESIFLVEMLVGNTMPGEYGYQSRTSPDLNHGISENNALPGNFYS